MGSKIPFPKKSGVSLAVVGVFSAVLAFSVFAQTPPKQEKCDVAKAADFAVQSHLQMVNSAAINPGKYFVPGGEGSCISPVMLQSFDLSNLIPDIMSLITGALESAINNVIRGAMRAVCNAANDAVQGTVGQLNTAIGQMNNMLNSDQNFKNLVGSGLGYDLIGGTYPAGTTYGVNPGGFNSAFGIGSGSSGSGTGTGTGTVTPGANGSNNSLLDQLGRVAGGAGNGNLSSTWGASSNSGSQAVALASQREQARIAMENAWSAYAQAANNGEINHSTAESLYQRYLNSVNTYNGLLQSEATAQAGANFGSSSNA